MLMVFNGCSMVFLWFFMVCCGFLWFCIAFCGFLWGEQLKPLRCNCGFRYIHVNLACTSPRHYLARALVWQSLCVRLFCSPLECHIIHLEVLVRRPLNQSLRLSLAGALPFLPDVALAALNRMDPAPRPGPGANRTNPGRAQMGRPRARPWGPKT